MEFKRTSMALAESAELARSKSARRPHDGRRAHQRAPRRSRRTEANSGFSAGETGGVHGANRPGGNSTVETTVFGRTAGREAAQHEDGLADPIVGNVPQVQRHRHENRDCRKIRPDPGESGRQKGAR